MSYWGRAAAHSYRAYWATPTAKPVGTASACTARGHHVWPRPEGARWRAHRRLNAGEGVEQTEGKWSPDLGLIATKRKPRRGGQEGGAH
jgi:hypothetical protein